MTPLAAVLVTYNSAHCVGACLASLRDLEPGEIVVVDNASDDGSADAVRAAAPDAVVLEPGRNLGFARACNLAVEHTRSTHVLFVNPDARIQRVNHAALTEELAHDPFGLVIPPLAPVGGGVPRHHVYRYPHWLSFVLAQAWGHMRPRELRRRAPFAAAGTDAWAAATVLLARRDELLGLGGFDPRYFLYAEDVDLSRRYREHGLPIRLTDALVAEHAAGSSSATRDDTRPVPHAWSILGTLEYVSIWNGDRTAARAASLVLASLRMQRRVLHAVPGRRGIRKRSQVEAITAFVLEHARSGTGAELYCPGAAAALRRS